VRGHYRNHGRDLPWRRTRDPWRILVSEVMLQQTQIPRVIGRYETFLEAFPDPSSAAHSPLERVLALWQGLGYNRRCLGLKRAATEIMDRFEGAVPSTVEDLESLPGIGPYTARAVAVFAFDQPVALIETNIRRTFIHWFFPGRVAVRDRDVMPLVERTMDRRHPREWFNALMDYGTWLAGAVPNPNRRSAHHVRQSRFEGSRRQLRGRVLARLVGNRSLSAAALARELGVPAARLAPVIGVLVDEGFLQKYRGGYRIR
jgi:A/G-specific adenine glycosylase